jgi:methyl-accepting chemotaxis protein I, serine sensor receptor
VVAGEVRSLAQRSASAAKEIKELIGDSVDKVQSGSTLVARAGTTMEEIVQAVRRVTDIMGEISAASEEQSTGIEQVNRAVVQMDEVTQQNAALVEEAAAAAASLEEQTRHLQMVVGGWHVQGTQRTAARSGSVARGATTPRAAGAAPAARSSAAASQPASAPASAAPNATAGTAGSASAPKQDMPRATSATRAEPALRQKSQTGAAAEPTLSATAAPAVTPRATTSAASAGSDADWETF